MNAQQLKNSILQMAFQGKLVPQDPNDEPASVLLERIRKEKEKLIKEGKIKKEKNPSYIFRGEDNLPYEKIGKNEPVCIVDEVPFEIPESWEWCRGKELAQIVVGATPSTSNTSFWQNGSIPWLPSGCCKDAEVTDSNETIKYITQEAYDSCSTKMMEPNSVIIALTGATAGRVGILRFKACGNQSVVGLSLNKDIMPEFIFYQLMARRREILLDCVGSAQPHISKEYISNMFFCIPPSGEQQRIVTMLNAIQPHIDEYDIKHQKLDLLNSSFPDVLKKSILQQAVMGKLVPQDSNDEPASVLLEKICAEKNALIKAGKLKKNKHESIIYSKDNSCYEKIDGVERCIDNEIPFEIPDSWEWCRLGDLHWYIDAGKSPKCSNSSVTNNEWGVITTTAIQIGLFDDIQNKKLPSTFNIIKSMQIQEGDVLITRAGPMNRTGIACKVKRINYNLILSDKTLRINMSNSYICKDYIVMVLNSPPIRKMIIDRMSGMDKQQVNVSQDKFKTLILPIPPLKEQYRIVAKLEEIIPHCECLFVKEERT